MTGPAVRLEVVPVSFRQAAAFVAAHHRHHRPPRGMKFALGVAEQATGRLVGVAMVGRPVARNLDDGWTVEVNRTCTVETPNANSALYGAAWRAASALGYRRLITYTEAGESGASLRGAGWRVVAERPPGPGWHRPSRPRVTHGTEHISRRLWHAPPPGNPRRAAPAIPLPGGSTQGGCP
jgi:hypothetical protein